jgi:O-antigen/teichoic acid export membrane protein
MLKVNSRTQVSATDEAHITTKNISALLVLKLLQYPFLFLFIFTIPRLMGPTTYGNYALFISIVMIASSITDFGRASEIFSRFVPEFESNQRPKDRNKIFGNIIFLQNIITVIGGIVFFFVYYFSFTDQFPFAYIILVLCIIFIRNNYSVFYAFLFGLNDLAKSNAVVPLRRVLSLVGVLVLYHYFGFVGAIVSTLLVDLCLATPAVYWTRAYFSRRCLNFDLGFMKPYLRYGVVFYFSAGLFTVWQKIGNILIERLTHDARQVAIFDIPNQLFTLMLAFIIAISFAFAPIFTKFNLDDKLPKLMKWSSLSVKYLGVLCTIIFLGFAINGEQLITLAVGSEYGESYLNGVIQLTGLFPLVVAYQGVLFSIVYKQPKKYFISLVVSIACFIISAWVLIPIYKTIGCAASVAVSCLVHAVFMYFSFHRFLSACLPNFLKTIGFGAIFLLVIRTEYSFLGGLALFVGITIGYIAILFIGKVLTVDECKDIFRSLRKKPTPVESGGPL